jgi:hypothetical protein
MSLQLREPSALCNERQFILCEAGNDYLNSVIYMNARFIVLTVSAVNFPMPDAHGIGKCSTTWL